MNQSFLANCIGAASTANARGQYADAAAWCRKALQAAPQFAEAWYHLGLSLQGQGQKRKAAEALLKAAGCASDNADAQNSIGLQLLEMGSLDEAEQCLQQAVRLSPEFAFAHVNLGQLREKQQRFDEAEAALRQSLILQPELAAAYCNLGGVLNAQSRYQEAADACRAALARQSDLAPAWNNLAVALLKLKQPAEAEAAARKAIQLAPRFADAWGNLACALYELRQYPAALSSVGEALAIDGRLVESWTLASVIQNALYQYPAAEAAARKAIELAPASVETRSALARALLAQKRHADAVVAIQRVLQIDPAADFMQGSLLHARMHVCDWQGYAESVQTLRERIETGALAATPFPVLALIDDPSVQYRAAATYAAKIFPARNELGPCPPWPAHARIRIGYFSADFHNHATAYLMAELFELHDKSRFELIAFSFGPPHEDAMRRRLAAAFDRFVEVRDKTDIEIARLARELEIDIAVDLKGYTEDSRAGIFAYRAAPVQVSYIGYPGTLGADYMDYIVADATVIPPEALAAYSEKVICLPDSYQVNDRQRQVSSRIFSRAELGLPDQGLVFCCFNSTYKITPTVFALWMTILTQVPDSVLWLLEDEPTARRNLTQAAAAAGVAATRLVFAQRMSAEEHLARHACADLFLDTAPYNAHTTTSDALWTGLPVLTHPGKSFASRVAASLVRAAGLPEMVVESDVVYVERAVMLARDPEQLSALRQRLLAQREALPLFDAARFTRHLEDAFVQIHARSQNGLAPDHVQIARRHDAGA